METRNDGAMNPRPIEELEPSAGENPVSDREWRIGLETLKEMLASHDGTVSSMALRKHLSERRVEDAKRLSTELRFFDFADPPPNLSVPDFRWYHHERSFYSEKAYQAEMAVTEAAVKEAERQATEESYEEDATPPVRRHRQEEARLCKYVEEALKDLYASDYGPDVPVAYDVHNERAGSEFENVDVIAVHWRSDAVVEIVATEVKLDFSPKLILQASNYKRFAHRVWAAVPVTSDEAGIELREYDPLLFEFAIDSGIGILACRKRQGNAYTVYPIHWPRLNALDSIARDLMIERYRGIFEDANVVEPKEKFLRPSLR